VPGCIAIQYNSEIDRIIKVNEQIYKYTMYMYLVLIFPLCMYCCSSISLRINKVVLNLEYNVKIEKYIGKIRYSDGKAYVFDPSTFFLFLIQRFWRGKAMLLSCIYIKAHWTHT